MGGMSLKEEGNRDFIFRMDSFSRQILATQVAIAYWKMKLTVQ